MSCFRTCIAAAIASAGLASCATDNAAPVQSIAPLRPLTVIQSGDGRFVACADCERPTPKTTGRTLQAATRVPGAVTAAVAARSGVVTDSIVPGPTPPALSRGALRIVRASVTFDAGSTALNAAAMSRLQRLAPLISQANSVRAVGFTDDSGTQEANDTVATSRALAVMVQLRRSLGTGPGGPALSAAGRGKCCYLNDNRADSGRAQNRRVDIQMRFDDTPAVDQLVARFADVLGRESIGVVARQNEAAPALAERIRRTHEVTRD
jgi:outer membrane protein OmpA-like peptidoglycan-associated protein